MDSETCGLHSVMVLLQWAVDDGPIHIYEVWREPVWKTRAIIEAMTGMDMVMFNAAFDWFHLAKVYTIWNLLPADWIPAEHVNEIAALEVEAQSGPCIKPKSVCDLLLVSRKGKYQCLMARDDIRIRRVPTKLAYALAEELEERIEIDGIMFAKRKDKEAPKWQVYEIKDRFGEVDPDFSDVVLRFNPAGGLKFLAEYAMGLETKAHFDDVAVASEYLPKELGYAPFAAAVSSADLNWEVYKDGKIVGYAWPGVIQKHIEHWATNGPARQYAEDDIVYTRSLWDHFDRPVPGDDDSELACMVAVVRWHGFEINTEGMKVLREKARAKVAACPININIPDEVRAYIFEAMDDTEMVILETSTKKANLNKVLKWKVTEDEECTKCSGTGGDCPRCEGRGYLDSSVPIADEHGNHPAALRAKYILEIKGAAKEDELYTKLLRAGKFHADLNVIGTLSSRMSGGSGLNAQGIKSTKEVRRLFPMAWAGMVLSGGDFDSFEVTLADAVYNDPGLRETLLAGKKIHAYFGMDMYPGHTYEQILASEGTDNDMYTKGKSGVFGMIYGGDWNTLVKNFGIEEENAQAAFEGFQKRYPGVATAREKTITAFCSMTQPGGIGTQVIWKDPAPFIESFLGFRRYFTMENAICRELFRLANNVPGEWKKHKDMVSRRAGRIQTPGGAVSSALYGAAFGIQAQNTRSACNHEIQSPGGEITKNVQRRIWDLQPVGAHPLMVAPLNVHDEILVVNHPSMTEAIAEKVQEGVEAYRPHVPLIGMTWNLEMQNWAEKKAGSGATLKIKSPEQGGIQRLAA